MKDAWGKVILNEDGFVIDRLALVDHAIDVASVFRALCELPGLRRTLDREAGCTLDSTQLDRLAVFALFHDLGKCNLGFQNKINQNSNHQAGHVRETAALFGDDKLRERTVAALRLEDMTGWFDDPETSLLRLLIAAISHHGEPSFTTSQCDGFNASRWHNLWLTDDGYDPFDAMAKLAQAASDAFPSAFRERATPLPLTLPLEHRFAGLLMLADWLGSHREAFFPFHQEGSRIPWAKEQAKKALTSVGMDITTARKCLASGPPEFSRIFAIPSCPKPLQAALSTPDLPPLLIAESDTGSGKTEAALIHFLSLFAAGEVDALYFALPTRVAAREIYGRVVKSMKNTFGTDCPPVLLAVPGYTSIDGQPADLLPDPSTLFHDGSQMQRERTWSAERPKRFLAAPIAVGTIDQALLSVIQVNHAHLRAACLDRSLLVIDEVHSSDVYMRYLIRRLLARHLDAGGRALLLSATLGSAARMEYLSPRGRPAPIEDCNRAAALPYPSLCAMGGTLRHLPDPTSRPKRVHIRAWPCLHDMTAWIPLLRDAIAAGQRVLVVLNTVGRAQALARLADADPVLAPAMFTCAGQRCPHHGRYARVDRERLDREVSCRLGKGSPEGALLLIGTQTLEQSLDIDADWLISDLCPIDVLLQRIGRLHRHDRGPRPPAICTVLLPDEADFSVFLKRSGEMARGNLAGLGSVYEDLRVLQLTRDWAAAEPDIELPRDNRLLVETATHPERLATLTGNIWQAHASRLGGAGLAQTMAAHNALIPEKHFGEFIFGDGLEDRFATRLGLNDRQLVLGGHFATPFGYHIDELHLPGHLAKGLTAEQAHLVRLDGDILHIHAGPLHFRYSRFGLEKVDEPAY